MVVLNTHRRLLYSIEQQKRRALSMMGQAKEVTDRAMNAGGLSNPDGYTLEDGLMLQAEADDELHSRLCMEKLIHGR